MPLARLLAVLALETFSLRLGVFIVAASFVLFFFPSVFVSLPVKRSWWQDNSACHERL